MSLPDYSIINHKQINVKVRRETNFIAFLLFWGCIAVGQSKTDSLQINVNLRFDYVKLHTDKTYISAQKDTLSFETVRFYLSNFEFQFDNNTTSNPSNSYHLIDLEDTKSQTLKMALVDLKKLTSITFSIGVDSLASVSGAMEGDLDATKGMYWSWQSGFINMKIEGNSSSCKTRKNKFQFHIGGYLEPYDAMKTIKIPIQKFQNTNAELNLIMDLGKLFCEISLKETNTIMIPGKEAMKMADFTSKIFSIE